MNISDIIVTVIIGLLIALAVFLIIRNRKNGCCGNCQHCKSDCDFCHRNNKKFSDKK
ncbi:MAG: FeoB-associated Cys-rich membrane protein [Oscillospiraceae bacterium]|nr:FeoB-associated Cys-rich membrane protein [Oscillospiraceae bacterium]